MALLSCAAGGSYGHTLVEFSLAGGGHWTLAGSPLSAQ